MAVSAPAYLARVVGQKKAREIWFLCDQYDAQEALDMGLVNKVVPLDELEATTVAWCRKMLDKSPLALRMLKSAFNAELDGQAGIQELAGNATLLYYLSEEAKEGKNAFIEKRKPDFTSFRSFHNGLVEPGKSCAAAPVLVEAAGVFLGNGSRQSAFVSPKHLTFLAHKPESLPPFFLDARRFVCGDVLVMYLNTYNWDHVYFSLMRFYMTLLMILPWR